MFVSLVRQTAKRFRHRVNIDLIALATRLGVPLPRDSQSLDWLEQFNFHVLAGFQLGTCVALADLTGKFQN